VPDAPQEAVLPAAQAEEPVHVPQGEAAAVVEVVAAAVAEAAPRAPAEAVAVAVAVAAVVVEAEKPWRRYCLKLSPAFA
jgi:hypothetical protein